MNNSILFKLFLLIIVLIISSSCSDNKNEFTDTPTSGEVTIGVDETFEPIIESEITVFNAIYNQANVKANYKTEKEIFTDLLNDSVRMIVASRLLNENEKSYFKSIKYFPKETKIAIDAIALIVNCSNTDSNLSIDNVRSIFRGDIENWNEISSKSNFGKIQIVFDNTSSSTVRYVMDSICKNGKLSKNSTALNSNAEVVEFVEHNKNSIGIIGVSWVSNKYDTTNLSFGNRVRVVGISLENNATDKNSYQPFQAYVVTGKYPLYRNIYMIISEPRVGLATGFGSFLASERGQRIILKSGILPSTQPIRIVHLND